ncbi:hypothetical protein FKP32DRAFT_1210236 [Trametes sanguinea]|nr:hypothetical protein FKP32DRAFT_1210236 [Trametes sanguinea]
MIETSLGLLTTLTAGIATEQKSALGSRVCEQRCGRRHPVKPVRREPCSTHLQRPWLWHRWLWTMRPALTRLRCANGTDELLANLDHRHHRSVLLPLEASYALRGRPGDGQADRLIPPSEETL